MIGFLYALFLKLFYPTSIALFMLTGSAVAGRRWPKLARRLLWLGILTILICGNGWLVAAMTKRLERRHSSPAPLPSADAILILSGGILARLPPRPTIEVGEAGDRILYGIFLYQEKKATTIICSGGVATGSGAARPLAEEMNEMLQRFGVPSDSVITERASSNTREHARNLQSVFRRHGFNRVLLVTSAMHMPRALAVFQKACPAVEFVPAPTDYRVADGGPTAWYRLLGGTASDAGPPPGVLRSFARVFGNCVLPIPGLDVRNRHPFRDSFCDYSSRRSSIKSGFVCRIYKAIAR